jgi:PAS domain S-box-containing protein
MSEITKVEMPRADEGQAGAGGPPGADPFKSVAQLNMLHSLAAKLNRLDSVADIGSAITDELRTILDYHNCRVYVLREDGRTLTPVAFRGELFSEYESETPEELITTVGEGITGWVAEHRESLVTPDAREVEFAITIPGTDDDILESMLAVPMLAGDQVIGVIVLSSLGYDQFDEDDQRMLEVLASHAAVAFENANLLQAERETAHASTALLQLLQALTGIHSVEGILDEALKTIPEIMEPRTVLAYVRNHESGAFALTSFRDHGSIRREDVADVPEGVANQFLLSFTEPFVLPREVVQDVPPEYRVVPVDSDVLVAPLRWEPDGFGALVLLASSPEHHFEERDHRLARGIADITSLALGNASRFQQLERFHDLVESLDAVFWEAEGPDLSFSFVSRRATELLAAPPERWIERSWGEHIREEDRGDAVAACRAVGELGDQSIEYRVAAPGGRTVWVRDLVHAVKTADPTHVRLRGLMLDVTERKRAEQALRRSERKYSDAFRREREAAQRLRALDDMKNTFLEAVSHDLRTPLTSILGSALTLERTELDLPRADAIDLVQRIAANARKLERLLSDLLDLDRLQRGIITPQRRATDIDALVRHSVDEAVEHWKRPVALDVQPMTVPIDAAKVERILENLLSNAMRHTPEGTRVWVHAYPQDGGVLLVVEDEGPGVPEDMREAIFEPFRQVPGSRSEHSPGVGVGLSLVKRFAELHGGRVWMQERERGGSSFRVFLPAG